MLANLASDLEVSPKTAKSWLEVLERMYLVFAVRPYTRNLPRAVLKPPKVYFFDVGDVDGGEGERFENLVAAGLLKRLHFLEDRDGFRYELRYIRDKEGHEVDFAIVKEGRLEEIVEAKLSDESPSRALAYFAERLRPRRAPVCYFVEKGTKQDESSPTGCVGVGIRAPFVERLGVRRDGFA